MKNILIPQNLEIPKLYETEDIKTQDKILQIKLFDVFGFYEWYITEYSPEEELAFGYVKGQFKEWGYISLKELKSLTKNGISRIERDINFKPIKFKDLI